MSLLPNTVLSLKKEAVNAPTQEAVNNWHVYYAFPEAQSQFKFLGSEGSQDKSKHYVIKKYLSLCFLILMQFWVNQTKGKKIAIQNKKF